jgi:hypothetical protein
MSEIQLIHLTTVDEVIDALGGTSAVARLTHRSLPAVSNWRSERRINPRFYALMIRELTRIGFTAEPSLWGQDALEAA